MTKETPRNREKSFPQSKVEYSRANSIDAFNVVDVLPNPDPILRNINVQFQDYQEILWDPHLTAVIASRKSVTLSKEWLITKGTSPARVHKLVQEAFKMFDVHRAAEEILDCRFFGMQPMEPIWDKPRKFDGENKIFPVEFIGRPHWWFQYDRENHLRFRSRENSWPGEEIKPFKLIIPRNNPKYDNPYGESLLSKVYWSVNFKKGALKFWMIYLEKYGSPIAVGKPPRNAGKAEFDELLELMKELTKGAQVVIPDDASIEFISVASKGGSDVFKSFIETLNAEISKAIIGQTLTTEAGDRGARALGQVHDNVRHDIAESDEILCKNCFNQLIRWIVDLNFGENVDAPMFEFAHEEDIKKDVAERDVLLKGMGVKFTPDYFQNTYNLTQSDFDLVEPAEAEPAGEPEFQETNSQFADQKAVDEFIASLSDKELQKQAAFVDPIIKMISKAGSFDEANEMLLNLFAKVRPELLEKQLGRAMFNTENLGRGGDPD